MNERFIYVFGEDSRDKFLLEGYVLLKSDSTKGLYIFADFADKKEMAFSLMDATFVRSNTLTF